MKISRSELKEKYGIDLPKGKYRIKVDGDSYVINTVKDDTEGCLLVGENKVVGQVINSRATYNKLFKILSETKERIIIEIRRKYTV